VPWNAPDAVVDVILKLRADPELRCRMGMNGHKVALREYDWNRLSVEFIGAMDAIAERVRKETAA
jgi:hypothetical protein